VYSKEFELKNKLLVSILVILLVSIIVPVTAQEEDQCIGNNYFVDDLVAWCILPEWSTWSDYYDIDTPEALSVMLEDVYNNLNVDPEDLSTFSDAHQIGVLAHGPVDKHVVIAQLFVTEFDESYSSAIAFIENNSIEYGESTYSYLLDYALGGPVGRVYVEAPGDEYYRAWFVYPFKEIGRTYYVALSAPPAAWEDPDIFADLDSIGYSLFISAAPEEPIATEEAFGS